MDIEGLNKTQLILLALLVSFVTSIATGIVTVSLMEQAPPSITQTINRVIKETERVIVPEKTQSATVETVVVKEEDYIVNAVDANLSNLVTVATLEKKKTRLGFSNTDDTRREVSPAGTGFVLTKDGILAFPDSFLKKETPLAVGTPGGNYFAASILINDSASGIVLARIGDYLAPVDDGGDAVIIDIAERAGEDSPVASGFINANLAQSEEIKLGQTAVALGMLDGNPHISLGTVSGFRPLNEDKNALVYTTLQTDSYFDGTPLLGSSGNLLGIFHKNVAGEQSAVAAHVIQKLLLEVIGEKEPSEGNGEDAPSGN